MPTNRRFVAHVDILGMRSMVRRDPVVAWNVLSELANVRDHIAKLQLSDIKTSRQQMLSQNIFSIMFSDTIVLFTKHDSNDELQSILIAAGEILHKAMCRFVPVRVGIASGQFFFNIEDSLYCGPALIDAYELGEGAQWIGVVTTEDIYQQACLAKFKTGDEDIIIPAEIPKTNGFVPGFALNWVATYRHDFKVNPPISTEQFYSQFEHAFGVLDELPEKERMKYVHTTTFVNKCLMKAKYTKKLFE